ncbi:MAG: NapC/NirT family cytochrome c [Gammaproteobacteria bacterium]|nr:NapC/NirT family cytochrome c [Gammaproteobacteria bacterium]
MATIGIARYITVRTTVAVTVGGLFGSLFILFLQVFDHYTSTESFCTTCHSMELVAVPYRESSHYRPASGVRAECGDCHVSQGLFAATWDHFVGSRDLYKQLFGANYDDPVINALHLPEAAFAAREWFAERQSATCYRCHTLEAIYGERPATREIHLTQSAGKSCIDCHINLVHRPVPDKKVFKREAWNRMIEEEFALPAGSAEVLLTQ